MALLYRFIWAVVIAVAVGIVLTALLGPILSDLKVPIADTAGKFLVDYGFVIGVLCGLASFATGWVPWQPGPRA